MIDPNNVPAVAHDELLARFIFQRSHYRQDGSVKQDAFMPPANLELSVTRHLLATESEIWTVGRQIGVKRKITLHGRADASTSALLPRLSVVAAPINGNPNHANVLGWPADKPAQKIIAQEI